MKILVIEDEKELSDSICLYLAGEDFLCETAYDYHSAMEMVHISEYVCILLDITLPFGSGLDILKELQKMDKADGVIIISARDSSDDKITGLQSGADDYVTKPFHLPELGARISAVVRRRSFGGKNQVHVGLLTVDVLNKMINVNGQDIQLTRKEYDLLLYFIGNKNRVVTKESIVEHLWGSHIDMMDSYDFIYAHIKNLRKKITGAGCPDYIKVVYGMGYKFSVD